MPKEEKSQDGAQPALGELEARLAKDARAQRIVATILADLDPPKELEDDVREAILRELERHGALR